MHVSGTLFDGWRRIDGCLESRIDSCYRFGDVPYCERWRVRHILDSQDGSLFSQGWILKFNLVTVELAQSVDDPKRTMVAVHSIYTDRYWPFLNFLLFPFNINNIVKSGIVSSILNRFLNL